VIFTASWSSLYRANQYVDELPVCAVRISKGVPRFWPAAADFPAIPELFPPGWVFAVGKTDPELADRGYRRGLHVLGVDRVRRLIAEAVGDDPRPPCLLCFEKDVRDCHRGQIAAVWLRWTGEPVPDLCLMRSRTTIALVHEIPNEGAE
jgi:hypothetical protein